MTTDKGFNKVFLTELIEELTHAYKEYNLCDEEDDLDVHLECAGETARAAEHLCNYIRNTIL